LRSNIIIVNVYAFDPLQVVVVLATTLGSRVQKTMLLSLYNNIMMRGFAPAGTKFFIEFK
jgi:hypothetical protein